MYIGKYENAKHHGRGRKGVALTVSLVLLVLAVVGGTVAFLSAKTAPVVNTFNYSKSDIDIEENVDGGVKKNVTIKNSGDVDVFVRAQIVVTWKNLKTGEISAVPAQEGTDYTMKMGSGWEQGKDGFWYCTGKVAAKTSSAVLITEAKPAEGHAPEGYGLSVEILAQGIQADGLKNDKPMVENFWPVTASPADEHPATIAPKN